MKNLTPELIAKAKTAKSAEELLVLAKENSVELTEEEAKIYFEQLNANVALSDDDLDAVSGGWDCPSEEEKQYFEVCDRVKIDCPYCKSTLGIIKINPKHGGRCVKCKECKMIVHDRVDDKNLVSAD